MFKLILYFLLPYIVFCDGIIIIQSPSSLVQLGSVQKISWSVPSGIKLKTTKIDIYQNSDYQQTLGTINTHSTSFQWTVSPNARLGRNYAIRVTGTSTEGKTAWATSNLFSIIDDNNHSHLSYIIVVVAFSFLLLLLLSSCICKRIFRKQSIVTNSSSDYYTMATPPTNVTYPPVATQIHNTTLPQYYRTNPVNPTQSGYSGTAIAGAALAGMVGGVVLDEAISGGGHHGHRNDYNNDFGRGNFTTGGDFETGDQDNGGDFGGGF